MRGGLCRRRRILGGRMGLVGSMAGSSLTAARKRSEWVWSCCCLMGGFLVLLLLLTCIGAVLWLVFRPHSPTLSLQALNITSLTVSCSCHFFSPLSLPPHLPPSLSCSCCSSHPLAVFLGISIAISTICVDSPQRTQYKP